MARANHALKMVAQAEAAVPSSKAGRHEIDVSLVAGKHPEKTGNAHPHEEFANLRDDLGAARAFRDRWGALDEEAGTQFGMPSALDLPLRVDSHGPDLELRDHVRKAWGGDKDSLDFIQRSVEQHMVSRWAFIKRRIEIIPAYMWYTICILFLRDQAANKTAICANPECHSPYFIRKRETQKFCGAGPCVAGGQRASALRWWNEKGKKRRAKPARRARSRRTNP